MDRMYAYCGIMCNECPTFKATKKDDHSARAKVAEDWSKLYQANLKPQDINCDGCQSTGERLFGHCRVCEVRLCGQDKGLKNCAYCPDYACDKLNVILSLVPAARPTLEKIRQEKFLTPSGT